jgi:hypothetical protein
MSRKSLIFAGVIGRYPVGGVTWCALHYIAGFQKLGFEVFYLEDTGEFCFDPRKNDVNAHPGYALKYIEENLKLVGLDNSWAYINHDGKYYGKSRNKVAEICRTADFMVNLSGGCWFSRPEYDHLVKIFIDTDPGFTQRAILEAMKRGQTWYYDFFKSYDKLFTFALNINEPSCLIAKTAFDWHPTIQPLAVEFWQFLQPLSQSPYTTILSWRNDSFLGMSKGKGGEIYKLIDLPSKISDRIVLAISGRPPIKLLTKHGWEITDAIEATISPHAYRSFIQSSKAELGFAKAMYAELNSGWFSDRTECYLASGRPALVRDTGFSSIIPCGQGLLTYSDEEELLQGIEDINSKYLLHCERAREIAVEFFSSEKVLTKLLSTAGLI